MPLWYNRYYDSCYYHCNFNHRPTHQPRINTERSTADYNETTTTTTNATTTAHSKYSQAGRTITHHWRAQREASASTTAASQEPLQQKKLVAHERRIQARHLLRINTTKRKYNRCWRGYYYFTHTRTRQLPINNEPSTATTIVTTAPPTCPPTNHQSATNNRRQRNVTHQQKQVQHNAQLLRQRHGWPVHRELNLKN